MEAGGGSAAVKRPGRSSDQKRPDRNPLRHRPNSDRSSGEKTAALAPVGTAGEIVGGRSRIGRDCRSAVAVGVEAFDCNCILRGQGHGRGMGAGGCKPEKHDEPDQPGEHGLKLVQVSCGCKPGWRGSGCGARADAMAATRFLDRSDGVRLAYAATPGRGPTCVFLPGYMSDMTGTKALHLESWAEASGRAFLRLDYSGCGASEGDFAAGTIRRWADDAKRVIETVTDGPVVLVGSSMGGWIMLHLALAMPGRVAALVGVAAAPDFTRWGLDLTPENRARLESEGEIRRPSAYGPEPYRYTAALVADGEAACLLDREIPFDGPVRLLHGMADPDVPFAISLRLAEALRSTDVRVELVKAGDHRLSTPPDLALLAQTLEELA